MAFRKGEGGRKVGAVNKITASAKEAFALAFEGMGGVSGLTEWAKANPSDFFKLYARLIPVELSGEVKAHITVSDDVPAK